jgi:hypothetical protein
MKQYAVRWFYHTTHEGIELVLNNETPEGWDVVSVVPYAGQHGRDWAITYTYWKTK